jgi:hypothetical protein
LAAKDAGGKSDPYVRYTFSTSLDSAKPKDKCTTVQHATLNPEFEDEGLAERY